MIILLYINSHVKNLRGVKVAVLKLANQTFETKASFVCPFSCRNFLCVVVSEMRS